MDNLQHMRALVTAVDTGSLSAAARSLDLTQSAVSQSIAALERSQGCPLLIRSRTGVRTTPTGRIIHEHGTRLLETLANMHTELDAEKGEVSGTLRVSTTLLLSQTLMGNVVTRTRLLHPKLKVDLVASDELTDIDADRIDFALRFGAAGTGPGLVRRIGWLGGALVATPAYLDQVGRPEGPEDLARLSYIQYREDPEETEMALEHAGGKLAASVNPSFSAQHPSLVLHAIQNDIGFAKTPLFYIGNCLDLGTLEEVLPGYFPARKPIYLVQAEHIRNTLKARAFREVLLEELAKLEGVNLAPDLAQKRLSA